MPNLQPATIQVRIKAKGFLAKTLLLGRAAGVTASTHPNAVKTALQCVCAFAVLYGISFFTVPGALIVGGLSGILAIERQ